MSTTLPPPRSSPAETIREYYARIDANDTAWVLALFAPTAVYERAGVTYRGADEIGQFFCVQRRIRGVHTIQHLWPIASRVIVAVGEFDGAGTLGDPRRVRFADVWWFGKTERVERRETFLATGHRYVEA